MSDKASQSPAERPLFGVLPDGTPLDIPIIGLCGPYSSGKTLAGLTICPEETIEIGVEDSGVTYNLPLKKRYSMYKEVTGKDGAIPKPIECWEWFAGKVNQINKGELKCRVLFVDPITDIQGGLVDWVKAHAADFGKSNAQYEKASGLLWADVKAHAKMLLGKLSSKCTLVFTAHMGSVWSGGAPVAGKQKAKGIDTFKELASLYVYLTREVNPQTGLQPDKPVGHICPPHGKSRLAHMILDENGDWVSKPILPPRIPEFTWANVRKYVAKPPDYAKLGKGEKAEVETLSDEDRLLIENQTAQLKLEEAQIRQELAEKAQAAASRAGSGVLSRAMGMTPPAATATTKAAPAEAKTEPKQEPVKTKAAEPAKTEPASTPDEAKFDRATCLAAVKDQIASLGMTPEQIAQSCSKRGCTTIDEMADDKLEEFRKALWNILTKREMEQKSGKAPVPKKS